MQRGDRGRGWGALAWRWHTQGSSNLLSRTRIKIGVLGREERAQALDLKEAFWFSEWPTTLGGRSGSIYSPNLKRVVAQVWWTFMEASERHWKLVSDRTSSADLTCLMGASRSRWGHSGSRPRTGLVRSTRQVQCRDRTGPVKHGNWSFGRLSTSTSHQTFSVHHSW
jgi:hypothetical protein